MTKHQEVIHQMSELNPDKLYEWFVIDAQTYKSRKSNYFVMTVGCCDNGTNATIRVRLSDDLKTNIVYTMMVATGYQDSGKEIDPVRHFKRGMHFHAKPVKQYHGGDIQDVRWTLAPDTLTSRKQISELQPETLDRIKLIRTKSPNLEEAIRRMSISDPALIFTFGYAVGAGVLTKEGVDV